MDCTTVIMSANRRVLLNGVNLKATALLLLSLVEEYQSFKQLHILFVL